MTTSRLPVFRCMRCSHCCYFSDERECPILLPHEARYIEVIASSLGLQRLVFEQLASGLYRWVIKGKCPFYDNARRACKIHGEKPLACKMFPLLVNTSTLELMVSSACKWVTENLQELAELGEGVEEVFPLEFNAVCELLSLLHIAFREGLVSVIYVGDSVGKALENKVNECIVKVTKSSVVKGLGMLIMLGRCEGPVEGLIRGLNLSSGELSLVKEHLAINPGGGAWAES